MKTEQELLNEMTQQFISNIAFKSYTSTWLTVSLWNPLARIINCFRHCPWLCCLNKNTDPSMSFSWLNERCECHMAKDPSLQWMFQCCLPKLSQVQLRNCWFLPCTWVNDSACSHTLPSFTDAFHKIQLLLPLNKQ